MKAKKDVKMSPKMGAPSMPMKKGNGGVSSMALKSFGRNMAKAKNQK